MIPASPNASSTISRSAFAGRIHRAGRAALATATIAAAFLAGACAGNDSSPTTPSSTVLAPVVSSVSPATGAAGATVSIALAGQNFVAGATTVTVSGTGVTVSGVNVTAATALTATLAVASTASAGPRSVTVTTAGGSTSAATFTVTNSAGGAPTIASLRQHDGATGTHVLQAVTGTGFVPNATTIAVSGSGVTVSGTAVIDSTSLTATFDVSGDAVPGDRTVTVTTPGGASAPVTFTITTPSQAICSPSVQTVVTGVQAKFSATGGYSSFSWSAPGGTPAAGSDAPDFATTYATPGSYAVTVTRGTSASCAVTVSSAVHTAISSFSATPASGFAGDPIVLAWTTSGGPTSCAIDNGVGNVACAGQVTVNPATATTYTLTATGPNGTVTAPAAVAISPTPHGTTTLNYTGAVQNFVVPAGVHALTLDVSGAKGGAGLGSTGGLGGRVVATVTVTPGETLGIVAAGQGLLHTAGFGGGGTTSGDGGGGGGASSVTRGSTTVVVAGGGGGGGTPTGGNGGAGGALIGAPGANSQTAIGGGGGTQSAGGAGGSGGSGTNGTAGTLGVGGTGGSTGGIYGAGGGGGGYYGGGGGAGGPVGPGFGGSGGGGGSSFTIPGATGVTHTQGVHTGNGVVIITW
jgi:hypothetical protein